MLLMAASACSQGKEDILPTAEAVRALTGASTRVVWVRHAGEGKDTYARTAEYRLMQFDTEGGERVLLDKIGSYAKPMITPKGNRVVFSDYEKKGVFIVDWDGKNLQKLSDGVAVDVWADPATGVEWVYLQKLSRDDAAPIVRQVIDDAEGSELVWNRTPVSAVDHGSFHLSADGKRAAALFPWPNSGLATLPNEGWTKLSRGCWTSIAPDNSYLSWVFDGAHQNVFLQAPGSEQPWRVPLTTAPGIARGEEVYHPRWSNHPRFMTMTGPYEEGRVEEGGRKVEVWLGAFNSTYTEIEKWVQVTRNDSADYFPDVWVENGAANTVDLALTPAGAGGRAVAAEVKWPRDKTGLAFLWINNGEANEVSGVGGAARSFSMTATGRAIYGGYEEMMPGGGTFVVRDGIGDALRGLAATGAFSIEALITPGPEGAEDAAVLTIDSAGGPLFSLIQVGDELRVRMGAGGEAMEVFGTKDGKPHHVLVTYADGELTCYRDGERKERAKGLTVRVGEWKPTALRFGSGSWDGHIEGVAIYNRALGKDEAKEHSAHFERKIALRPGATPLVADARLESVLRVPAPAEIAPYRRALVVHEYAVENVVRGTYGKKKLSVVHWSVLDAEVLKPREIGKTYRLHVEPFEEHPELTGERLIVDEEDLDAELFYSPERGDGGG